MKLLSFNEIKTKSVEFIADNFNKIDWDDIPIDKKGFGAKKANEVITTIQNRISGINLDLLSFDDLVPAIRELLLTEHNLNRVKSINCSTYSGRGGNNTYYKCEQENYQLINNLLDKVKVDKFSTMENLILMNLTKKNYSNGYDSYYGYSYSRLGHYDIPSFDPITEDMTDIMEMHKKVNSFNYKKYGLNKEEVVEKYNDAHVEKLEKTTAFKVLKAHAGDEIIIWSAPKITRRLDKLGFKSVNRWSIQEYLNIWVNHLKKKGVKIYQNLSSVERSEMKYAKGNVDQEDLFRLFKRGSASSADGTIDQMNLSTLTELMDSELKCVAERASGRLQKIMQRVMHLLEGGTKSIKFLKKLMRESKDNAKIYRSIVTFLQRHDKMSLLTPGFFSTNSEFVTAEDIVSFINSCGSNKTLKINDSFFENVLSKLPKKNQLTLHPDVNAQFIKRMSVEDKIKVLGRKDTKIWTDDFEVLFADVPWESIKTLIEGCSRRAWFMERMVKEQDFTILKDVLSTFSNQEIKYFQHFSFQDKVDILFAINKKERSYHLEYNGKLDKIFNPTELEEFLKIILPKEKWVPFTDEILKILNKKRAREVILECPTPRLSLDKGNNLKIIQENIDVTKRVLKCNSLPEPKATYYHYIDPMVEFLRGIKSRKYAEAIFGKDFKYTDYGMYLAHLLTEEEIIQAATNKDFFRENIEYLPDHFLKPYKTDEDLYKQTVGNRTYRENRDFHLRFQARLEKIAT